ncbi:hypothetical protein [Bacillus halotolerans]|uniref:hypothetical protein n=1 Tax=Bacillus halotolerans TaxID=260554 RepID=UPI00292FC661|nr:hypothetical protein [Bacillus halotolerans]
MFKKSILALSSVALSVSLFAPFASAKEIKKEESVKQNVTIANTYAYTTPLQESVKVKNQEASGEFTTQGIKGKIVSAAVRALAQGIRSGSWVVSKIIGWLDEGAAKAFRKHADDIADELDYIAKIPDLAVDTVRKKLYNYLVNDLELDSGDALVIAEAVEGVLWILL